MSQNIISFKNGSKYNESSKHKTQGGKSKSSDSCQQDALAAAAAGVNLTAGAAAGVNQNSWQLQEAPAGGARSGATSYSYCSWQGLSRDSLHAASLVILRMLSGYHWQGSSGVWLHVLPSLPVDCLPLGLEFDQDEATTLSSPTSRTFDCPSGKYSC